MSNETTKLTLEKLINSSKAETLGVQALSNRPNQDSAYGEGGLSATDLKKRFDLFPQTLADAIAEIQAALNGENATKYILTFLDSAKTDETLYDLIGYITSGDLATTYLKMPKEAADNAKMLPIASIIYSLQSEFGKLTEETNTSFASYKEEINGKYTNFTEEIDTTLATHQAAYERIITYLESGELGLAEEGEF